MKLSDKLAALEEQDRAAAAAAAAQVRPGEPVRRRLVQQQDPKAAKRSSASWQASKMKVRELVLDELGPKVSGMSSDALAVEVKAALDRIIQREDVRVSPRERRAFVQEMIADTLGYGPLDPLLQDPSITEVMCNAHDDIWVERDGKLHHTGAGFTDDRQYRHVIEKIVAGVGRRIDESSPMVDARLPDGSRVNAVIPPLAIDGSLLTIRKFSADPYTSDDLVAFGTYSARTADFLAACVRGKLNVVISGSTGAGKTTTLNVLSGFIPVDERVVTVEDAAELQLHQDHVVRLESRPANTEGRGEISIRDLVRNALRMRPDRIVVGEVRDGAALDMLQAMNTGHDGSLTTVHANSPRDSIARLETMVLMAGMDLPVRAIREQVASAVDLIIQVSRLKDGSRRITHITEVVGMEGDVVTLQDIFTFDYRAGMDERGRFLGGLKSTGLRPRFMDELAEHGVKVPSEIFTAEGAAR